jgi:hypothetical protein
MRADKSFVENMEGIHELEDPGLDGWVQRVWEGMDWINLALDRKNGGLL